MNHWSFAIGLFTLLGCLGTPSALASGTRWQERGAGFACFTGPQLADPACQASPAACLACAGLGKEGAGAVEIKAGKQTIRCEKIEAYDTTCISCDDGNAPVCDFSPKG